MKLGRGIAILFMVAAEGVACCSRTSCRCEGIIYCHIGYHCCPLDASMVACSTSAFINLCLAVAIVLSVAAVLLAPAMGLY